MPISWLVNSVVSSCAAVLSLSDSEGQEYTPASSPCLGILIFHLKFFFFLIPFKNSVLV